jgi:arylsulfatase A-like enzyme
MKQLLCLLALAAVAAPPNILWLSSEDNGPHLGCYGDAYATTPNLDALAAKGLRYLNAWSNAPVCAPARTTIISGLYPPATGSEHMRSNTALPPGFKMFPQYLREAGYYCTNRSKEDYNLAKPGQVWDESSRKAHWKNRKPGQPFFAVFNYTISHESKLRTRPHTAVHDPAKVRVPAYHPDIPEVRQDWAQYYDKITEMDNQLGNALKELEAAGLADSTIVVYWGDHGSGMPRNKRWPYNSGLHVPLIVHVPEALKALAPEGYAPGGTSDRLVGFIDFAPSMLSICGIKPPEYFHGHAFMGAHAAPEQPFAYGFRGRMDERNDLVRVVRDKRYIYIRNYNPHKIYGQYIQYMFQTPTTRRWHELYTQGKLQPPQTYFWESKPAEELYDLEADRDEVNNLANSAEHAAIKAKLRTAQQTLARDILDVGFLPEIEIHSRSAGRSPYEVGHDPKSYDFDAIFAAAESASMLDETAVPELVAKLKDADSAVRYWAAMGLLMRGETAVAVGRAKLQTLLKDEAPAPRIAAAEALGRYGKPVDVRAALPVLLEAADGQKNPFFVALLALNAIDAMDERAAPIKAQIAALPEQAKPVPPRHNAYLPNLLKKILADLD